MKERIVLLMGREDGQATMDYPVTRLSGIEGGAEVKEAPGEGDYIPIIDSADGGQMKKITVEAIRDALSDLAGAETASNEEVNEMLDEVFQPRGT